MALLGGKLWGAARMPLGVEAGVSLVVKRFAPSTDGAGRSAHLARHLTKAPPRLEQGHSNATADFKLEFGAFRSHTAIIDTLEGFL